AVAGPDQSGPLGYGWQFITQYQVLPTAQRAGLRTSTLMAEVEARFPESAREVPAAAVWPSRRRIPPGRGWTTSGRATGSSGTATDLTDAAWADLDAAEVPDDGPR
ncbi:hypothetical protein, partial [Streptomyces sp. NPDC056707]|uniref:hypothetical protein n=1 Tax=Streptomyces sp. NPDC056707 TaxID=3345919 RepID=UPI00367525B3